MKRPDEMKMAPAHIPVLLPQVVEALAPGADGRYLDGTLGLGGHAEAVLKAAPACQLCGLDRDGQALELARARLRPFGGRAHAFHLPFAEFPTALRELGWDQIDGALLDLGVSSLQLDDDGRGFSFRQDGPLDMRMNQDAGVSARELVNGASFAELRDWLATYGEERLASKVARRIVEARQKERIDSTARLAEIVASAYPYSRRKTARRHPATKVFQALRMQVNDEPGQLRHFLEHIWSWLAPGARLAIISFHSIEDRMVKRAMRDWATPPKDEYGRHLAVAGLGRILYKKPVVPSEAEMIANPRSRSAKLRVVEKLERQE